MAIPYKLKGCPLLKIIPHIKKRNHIIAKTVNTLTVGINPNLIIDERKLLINLQLIFPDKDFSNIKKKIKKKNIFESKKDLIKIKLKDCVIWAINQFNLSNK